MLLNGECLKLMENIPDKSIDLILCDLPYETSCCKWDSLIDFDKLWKQYKRIIKDNRAIVLFGQEPFTSKLMFSNIEEWKYNWIWIKNKPTNFMNAKNSPLKKHEIISVFSNGTCANKSNRLMKYNPQGLIPCNKIRDGTRKGGKNDEHRFGRKSHKENHLQEFTNYPNSILTFDLDTDGFHPTQKPVKLLEYLIRTYSDENELVLDNCAGSFSTGIACINTNRDFIGIEMNDEYYRKGTERMMKHMNKFSLEEFYE